MSRFAEIKNIKLYVLWLSKLLMLYMHSLYWFLLLVQKIVLKQL